jgi:hypothetical protein
MSLARHLSIAENKAAIGRMGLCSNDRFQFA